MEGSLQGTNLAWFIVKWAMTLRWPSHDAVFDPMTHPGMAISWGVSWFELYVNFLLGTSQYIPARISGSLENVIYTHRIHGAGIYANMTGEFLDGIHVTINIAAPLGSVMGYM